MSKANESGFRANGAFQKSKMMDADSAVRIIQSGSTVAFCGAGGGITEPALIINAFCWGQESACVIITGYRRPDLSFWNCSRARAIGQGVGQLYKCRIRDARYRGYGQEEQCRGCRRL